jgi:hypothetical protein
MPTNPQQGQEETKLGCRCWVGNDNCGKPARYIIWGKLFDKDKLGPRCEDCAVDQVGWQALRDPSYAIYKLPDLPALRKQWEAAVLNTVEEATG